MDKQGGRLAGVSGILFVVLIYSGVILGDTGILGGEPEPPPDAGGEEFVVYFTSSHSALLLKSYLVSLSFCFFLIFLVGLYNAVLRDEQRLRMLGLVAFGGGVTATALQLASQALQWVGASSAQKGLEPQTASVLREVGTILWVTTWFPLAVLLAATALGVAVTHALLPRVLGWTAGGLAVGFLGVALLMALSPASLIWIFVYMLFALWIITTSIILIRRAGRRRSTGSL